MASVVMQYKLFGKLMARTSAVQRLVGVHKVETLALRRILCPPGLHLDKAAILCGGPDWPTVVLCGILRTGLGRTLVGELPNVLIVVPYAYAGACWLEDHLMDVSSITILVTCLVQNFSFLAALLLAASEATSYQSDMRKSRAEHLNLHTRDAEASAQSRHFKRMTEWRLLSATQRAALTLAAAAELAAFWAAVILTNSCFRDFSLSRRIDDGFEDGGLAGNPLNLLLPTGWGFASAFLGGALLLLLYSAETRFRIRTSAEDMSTPASSPRSANGSAPPSSSGTPWQSEEGTPSCNPHWGRSASSLGAAAREPSAPEPTASEDAGNNDYGPYIYV